MQKPKNQHRADNIALSAPKLKEIGVTPIQSSRWQRSASVPEPVFAEYVEQSTASGKEITSAGLYKLANKVAPKNGAKIEPGGASMPWVAEF